MSAAKIYDTSTSTLRDLTTDDLGGSGGVQSDRELVVSVYRCKAAFTGASVGDTITATQVIDVSGNTPSTVSTIWRNQSAAADLAGAPSAANLEIVGSSALTDTQLRATPVPVSGTVTANTGLAQPLTDTQLRATPVPVSGTVTANTGLAQPLTDTQLRATPVPISGTVTANTGLTQPLTDTQLRASAVPISASALPLPSGAATSAAQATGNTSLGNIDADLGATSDAAATSDTGTFSLIALVKRGLTNWTTLLARIPALVGGRLPVDGSGVTQPVSGPLTDTQLRATPVPISGTVTANTGLTQPLTDTQLRATPVPVSGPLTDTQLRASAVAVTVSSAQRTASLQRVSTSGTVSSSVASGSFSVSFSTISGSVTVAGAELKVGETVDFVAPLGDKLNAIAYTVAAGELVISRVS